MSWVFLVLGIALNIIGFGALIAIGDALKADRGRQALGLLLVGLASLFAAFHTAGKFYELTH